MKWLLFRLTIFTAWLAAAGQAAEVPPSLAETRSTLEQWVQTRQLISKTRSDWDADKETLAQTTALYERELKSIAEQMSKVSTNNAQVEKERLAATATQSELEAAAEQARTLVAGLEKRVQEIAPSFPPPLAEKLASSLKRIPADPANTKMSGLERMQNVVGILNEVDKFNAAVTVVSEVQKNSSGAEVQVETLYLGLAQAYFVDKAGEYAGLGTPAATGWEWTANNALAGKIQKTIAMYKNATPADFVSLPVQIK
jgi:hypothetical protein